MLRPSAVRPLPLALALAFAASCTADDVKDPITDDLSGLSVAGDGQEGKADTISLVGTLKYGKTSSSVSYYSPPEYRAFKFSAAAGDEVEVEVRSTTGDAVGWVLDDDLEVLAYNDDASGSTYNSHIELVIPASASATHYVVFRDYYFDDASFRVELNGRSPLTWCERNSDCRRIERGCCDVGDWIAVRADRIDDYEDSLDCPAHPICPLGPVWDDGSYAACNGVTDSCEIRTP
jgi:hypothetical protein